MKTNKHKKNIMLNVAAEFIKLPKTSSNKPKDTAYTLGVCTNRELYLLVNLEAKLQGRSVSSLLESALVERYKHII